ncbi:MAG: PASTA domain-containing protein, partial [Ruminococcus sp.]|nr:PASTA domain-containing protein [Ruminococcus sp.]
GVLAIVRGITSNQAKDVQVPAYVGKSLMEIKENNPENFQFEIKSRYDQSQTPGVVLAQDPVEYMTVKSGSVVTLTVNSSDDEIAVPFFNSSFKKEDVVKKIKELGLVPEEVKVEDANAAKDYVVGTFPVAGAKTPVGSTVYIYVSNGERPNVVEIPSVIGMTLSEAEDILENLGITVQTKSDDESREKKDTVIAATPLPHGKVEAGTVVVLTVSSGKGDKSKVTLNVDMPKNVDKMIELTVTVDGERDEEKTQQVNPIETPTVKIEIENSGTKTVVVLLDNQPYREYKLDFTLGTVNTTVYEYVPVTEAPTYYVEPYTEYVDPYSGGGYVDPNAYDSTVYDPNAYLYNY